MTIIIDPFFWAFISMFAFIGSSVTLCSKQLGKFPQFNIFLVAIFTLGRFILVLPFCQQPRFEIGGLHYVLGGIIFAIGLIFLIPLFHINPFPAPDGEIKLVTTGFYSIVRNPIYLGEILWSLGWAIMFRSVIGIALVPFWWGGLLFHVILEEEELERKLGLTYTEYKSRVRGRIIPGLPV
jgi:protein-S-isoprenylcysteine O-methyltransferase Ste14